MSAAPAGAAPVGPAIPIHPSGPTAGGPLPPGLPPLTITVPGR
jgi:hypothetical protein